jgi:hypothetical protein
MKSYSISSNRFRKFIKLCGGSNSAGTKSIFVFKKDILKLKVPDDVKKALETAHPGAVLEKHTSMQKRI